MATRSSRSEELTGKGFEDVSLRCRRGEVVGLYGLIGAGRSEFVQSIYRPPAKTGGQIFWKGKPVEIKQRNRCHRARHRAGAGKPPRSRPLPEPPGRPQHQPADLQASDQGTCRSTVAEKTRAPISRSAICRSRRASRDAPAIEPVRRQPAEDRHRQMAEPRRQSLHLRRADRRRRCRHQGRNLPAVRQAAEAGRRHHPDLLLPAGGLRSFRHPARLSPRATGRQLIGLPQKASTRRS